MIKSKLLKKWGLIIGYSLVLLPFFSFTVMAADTPPAGVTGQKAAGFLADTPANCKSTDETVDGKKSKITPRNCLFLEEPIGGKSGYDLYTVTCITDPSTNDPVCEYKLWGGGALQPGERGPIQAILTMSPDKPEQGPFGLLYSYIGLVYNYMSGLIVGVSVLFVVIGGIQMSTSGGDDQKVTAGKGRITKAIVGLIIWFTASLILYTINPTFFTFYQGV